MPGRPSEWLLTTLNAVRDAMLHRLEQHDLDAQAEREMQMAVEMLAVMWDELVGQHESLQREQERYSEFFDHAPDAYAITDAGCNVREANFALASLLGIERERLLGAPLTRYVLEDDRSHFLARFLGASLSHVDAPVSWRCRVQPAGSAPLEVLMSVRPIPLRKSGVRGLCWLVRRTQSA